MQTSIASSLAGLVLLAACDFAPGSSDADGSSSSSTTISSSSSQGSSSDGSPGSSTTSAGETTDETTASDTTGLGSTGTGDPGSSTSSGEASESESGSGAASVIYTVRAEDDRLVFTVVDLDDGSETILADDIELEPGERLVALSPLGDGRFVAGSVYSSGGVHSRLTFLDVEGDANAVEPTGLQANWSIENLMALDDVDAIAVVSLSGGVTPFVFADVDLSTFAVDIDEDAPPISVQQRVDDLTRCPDGTIYLTSVAGEGTFRLAQLVPDQPMLVLLDNYTLPGASGIGFPRDLDCAADGTLYMLADDDSDGAASLFTVDTQTSALTFVRDLAVHNTAFDL